MARPKPVLGYPSRHEAAAALRAQGLKHREIAALIGCNDRAVGNLLRHAAHKGAASLGEPAGRALRLEARRRGLSLAALKNRLLRAVVDARQVAALLDTPEETD